MAIIVQYNTKNEEARLLQKALNEKLDINLTTDGAFGKISVEAFKDYQEKMKKPQTGIYNSDEYPELAQYINKRFVREVDVRNAGKEINVDGSVIMAFRDVESKFNGFLPDGRAVILFERHYFYKLLSQLKGEKFADSVSAKNPDICNTKPGGYKGGTAEWTRLTRAEAINNHCAIQSASWGMFQVMGAYYKLAGYNTPEELVQAYGESEKAHLEGLIKFIKSNPKLLKACQQKDAVHIAMYYNGAGYAVNQYDKLIAQAIKKYS